MKGKILDLSRKFKCMHRRFTIDPCERYVRCATCDERLDPMWALSQLANKESGLRRELEHVQKLVDKNEKKLRCKCQHCGKMTKIIR